jgi:hypothetical protein
LQEGFLGDTINAFAPGLELDITFLDPLTSANSPDGIGKVVWFVTPITRVSAEFISSASSGSAVIVAPEPDSALLLVSLVLVVGFLTRR